MNVKKILVCLMLGVSLSAAGLNAIDQPFAQKAIAQTMNPQTAIEPTMNRIDQLAGTEWLLEDLAGAGVIDNVQTTLRFEGTTAISGGGGCNRYRAGIQSEGSEAFTVSAVAATRMACVPAVMNQEFRYFEALQTAQRITLDGENLLIFSEGNAAPLRFTRLTASSPEADAIASPIASGNPSEMQTLTFFEGRRNVVRVFVVDGQMRMNVYDKQDRVTWVRGVEVDMRQTREGTVYTNRAGEVQIVVIVPNSSEPPRLVINGEIDR